MHPFFRSFRLHVLPFLLAAVLTACGGGGSGATNASSTNTSAPTSISAANTNQMGINIGAPADYGEDRLYADVMKTSHSFVAGTNANGTTPASLDANGWPTSDFSFYVWAGIDNMQGTYTLSFTGQAVVTSSPSLTMNNVSYNAGSNTTSMTFNNPSSSAGYLSLSFSNTQRVNGGALGTGVTHIQIMRPVTPGSTTSFSSSVLFNTPLQAEIAKFSVIRFMDFMATNWNVQVNWSDRMLPGSPSYNRNPGNAYGWEGLGGPWEDVILLANTTGKDAWINIPAMATDAYVTDVANMFKYGSDGVNPYTSVQANPVYPPLNPNLNLYVEYSNELWNGSFGQFSENCQEASAELAAGNSPLNWDSSWNGATYSNTNWQWAFCWRHVAERAVGISNDFRAVFGDAAMGTRIRPVLESQFGGGVLPTEAGMMLDYYDNLSGTWVTNPHPPSYYIYGAGGAFYYNPTGTPTTLDAFFADPGMNPSSAVVDAIWQDTALASAMGVQHLGYEGGPNLVTSSNTAQNTLYAAAVNDPRMTTAVINMQHAWTSNGGGLFTYLTSTGNYEWGFTPDVYNLNTMKLAAIDQLNASQKAPLTMGAPVPGSVTAMASSLSCSREYNCGAYNQYTGTLGSNNLNWGSYAFASTVAATWTINLTFTAASGASVAVYVDGVPIGTPQSTTGTALSFSAGTIGPGLHSIIVRAVSGTFTLASVAVSG